MVTIREIAWAAGVYEGEGSFSGDQAIIVQKDSWILIRLSKIFNFGSIRLHGDNCLKWCLSGKDARKFILTIFTELSPRRKSEILKYKTFFVDDKFKQQRICRNGHNKTEKNTKLKRRSRKGKWDTICLDCMVDRKSNKGEVVN